MKPFPRLFSSSAGYYHFEIELSFLCYKDHLLNQNKIGALKVQTLSTHALRCIFCVTCRFSGLQSGSLHKVGHDIVCKTVCCHEIFSMP